MTNRAEALAKALENLLRGHQPDIEEFHGHKEYTEARAALEAYRSQPDGWRPISEAPKDGDTRILLGRTGYAEQQAVCWWSRSHDAWLTVIGGCTFYEATHWQPLPESPSND